MNLIRFHSLELFDLRRQTWVYVEGIVRHETSDRKMFKVEYGCGRRDDACVTPEAPICKVGVEMKGAGSKDKEGLETSSSAFSITSIAGSLERWEGKTVEVEAGATASDCRLTALQQRGHRFMVARRRLPRPEGGRTLELPEVRPNKALRNEEATAKRDSGLVLDLDFRFSFLLV